MKPIASHPYIKSLGTILSVWAHPDDESYCSAGIMAAAVQNGQTVVCITATKGEAGVQDESRWPSDHLGEIRAQEMTDGLAELGVKTHYWLGYPDGGCKDINEAEAVNKLKGYIDKYQPDSILTFGPDGLTGHEDHKTVSSWATKAAAGHGITVYYAVELRETYEKMRLADEKFNIFFNIDRPLLVEPEDCAILVKLSDGLMDKKYKCLCAMPSQTESMFKHFGRDTICEMICTEAFVQAKLA